MFLRADSGAGAWAAGQFRAARGAWRRRVSPRVGAAFLVALVVLYAIEAVWGGHLLDWTVGILCGALVGVWMWLWDSPPARIEAWRIGADAERRTARTVRPLLGEGWHVVHDLPAQRGNRDHVVVGSAGVVLLDSKHLGGTAVVEGELVRVERPDNPRATYQLPRLAAGMRAAATSLKADLQRPAGGRVWVHANVVL